MENNNEITRVKKKIRAKLISKELTNIIVGLISFIMLSVIFGYIGYKFCLDNEYDIQRGIVFSIFYITRFYPYIYWNNIAINNHIIIYWSIYFSNKKG